MKPTLIDFAVKMDVSPEDAVVLPALFDQAAEKLGKTRDELLAEVMTSDAACEYLVGLCRDVANQYRETQE